MHLTQKAKHQMREVQDAHMRILCVRHKFLINRYFLLKKKRKPISKSCFALQKEIQQKANEQEQAKQKKRRWDQAAPENNRPRDEVFVIVNIFNKNNYILAAN